jgi:flagellar motor switch protein FliM
VENVLVFNYKPRRLLDVLVNGKVKYRGIPASCGRKKAVQIQALSAPSS